MNIAEVITRVILVGIGATVVMDVWLTMLKYMGVQTLNFAFIGRWAGHLFRGRFAHRSIGQAQAISGEVTWGWLTHYAVGIAFAGLLVAVHGTAWLQNPSILPAVAVGFSTVIIPLFVMQPAMGLGFAASRTPAPLKSCLRSMANHTVFGLGLYLSAVVIGWISR
ncbi:DUF2938 domain-containing protein [Herbaspirillum sp. GCM10030257]|uniref:DUF2938 domain-containing protein n=1 Tax=Herbaspirillum sp. GCM10030257 TaxID=3273393 RepID=UPI0036133107